MTSRLSILVSLTAVFWLFAGGDARADVCGDPQYSVISGTKRSADGSTPPVGESVAVPPGVGPVHTRAWVGSDSLSLLNLPECDSGCGKSPPMTGPGPVNISCGASGFGTYALRGGADTLVPYQIGTSLVNRVSRFYFTVEEAGTVTCSPTCSGSPDLRLYARFGTIKGRVVHRTGPPMAGIVVVAYPANPSAASVPRMVTTDQDGYFDFTLTDAAHLFNQNGEAGTGAYVERRVTFPRENNWGLKLCGTVGEPADCPDRLQRAEPATRDFYVVAGYLVRGADHASSKRVPVTSSQPTDLTIVFQDDPEEGDPNHRPACKAAVGEPVSVFTGNVFFDVTDARLPGRVPGGDVVLRRSYNSANVSLARPGMFGPGWSHAYERRLDFPAPGVARLRDESDMVRLYKDQDGDGRLEPVRPYDRKDWVAFDRRNFWTGGHEAYGGPNGALTEIANPTGTSFTRFRYEPSTGRLSEITVDHSVWLTFTYSGDEIIMRDGEGRVHATYRLEGGLLAQVTYPTGDGYRYTYDPVTKELLTVADLSSRFVEKHAYVDGRAVLSEIADGRERYEIAYEQDRTLVTDAREITTVYEFGESRGEKVLTAIEGGCSACGAGQERQEWTYDPATGKVATYRDGAGNLTRYEHDPVTLHLMTETRYPDPANPERTLVTGYTYWPDRQVKSVSDPKGGVTEWTYVAAGPQTITTKISAEESRVTHFTYAQALPEWVIDPRQRITQFTWHNGRVATITDPAGQTTTYERDPRGYLQRVVHPSTDIPSEEPTTYYDLRGRPRFIVNPGGTVDEAAGTCTKCTRLTYDRGGRLESRTDPLNHRTTYEYDPYGRLEFVKDSVDATTAQVTTYGYDLMSNVVMLRDARGKETHFEYDDFNRLWKVRYPLGAGDTAPREEVFTYDGAGHVKTHTDRRGVVATYDYDGLGRLTGKTYAGPVPGAPVTFTYDDASHLKTAATSGDGAVSLTWDHDLAGQLTFASDGSSTLDYTYWPDGMRKTLALRQTGLLLEYDDDDAGRPWHVYRGTDTFTFEHDAASRRRSLTLPNGVVTTYTPDLRSRLSALAIARGETTLQSFGYAYDDDDNRRQKTVNGVAEDYSYDPLHRLDTTHRGGSLVEDFGYDPVGNRKGTLANPDPNAWVYSDRNELEKAGSSDYQYDENGNLTRKTDGRGTWTYGWDVENQLVKVTLNGSDYARYRYDPLGRRIERTFGAPVIDAGARHLYSYDGDDIIRERLWANRVERQRQYIHGPAVDEPLAVLREVVSRGVRTNEGTRYYHADGLGSIVGATDASGAMVETRSYDVFGNLETGTHSGYAFTGREWDAETGLYYYRARYYDPKIGRFISEDPIGLAGGINAYTYVANRPSVFTDPSGLKLTSVTPYPVDGREVLIHPDDFVGPLPENGVYESTFTKEHLPGEKARRQREGMQAQQKENEIKRQLEEQLRHKRFKRNCKILKDHSVAAIGIGYGAHVLAFGADLGIITLPEGAALHAAGSVMLAGGYGGEVVHCIVCH